jgi:hypothetical protein
MVEDPPPSRIEDLQVRFAGQLFQHPSPWTYNSPSTRRCHRSTTWTFGKRSTSRSTAKRSSSSTVDPGSLGDVSGPTAELPGYEPYCPYTIDRAGGQWTGPDMERAQDLVRRSGAAGPRDVLVLARTPRNPRFKAEAEYFVHLLEELHFVADLRSTADTVDGQLHGQAAVHAHYEALSRGIQIAPAGWGADYPVASFFMAF